MKFKQIIKIILVIMIILFIINIINKIDEYNKNLFSWKMNAVENSDEFLKIVKKHKITNVYQDFTTEYLEQNKTDFIKKLHKEKINVYYLTGDPSWGKEKTAKNIIREANKIIRFNKVNKYKIKGIVLDVEPYNDDHTKEFTKQDFKIFVSIIEKAYEYFKNNDIELVLCIPFWYETIDENLLEKLIKNVDKIEVMNYNQKNTLKHIREEIKYASKYHKKISSIYEINFEEKETFKNFKDIEDDFLKIDRNYLYEKLEITYHHYNNILEEED